VIATEWVMPDCDVPETVTVLTWLDGGVGGCGCVGALPDPAPPHPAIKHANSAITPSEDVTASHFVLRRAPNSTSTGKKASAYLLAFD